METQRVKLTLMAFLWREILFLVNTPTPHRKQVLRWPATKLPIIRKVRPALPLDQQCDGKCRSSGNVHRYVVGGGGTVILTSQLRRPMCQSSSSTTLLLIILHHSSVDGSP